MLYLSIAWRRWVGVVYGSDLVGYWLKPNSSITLNLYIKPNYLSFKFLLSKLEFDYLSFSKLEHNYLNMIMIEFI